MSKDATKVRVALTGSVYVADEGTAFPTTISEDPATDFTDLGYTTEDGVTFTIDRDTTEIMGWQSVEPLRVVINSEPKTISTTLRQLQRQSWTAAFGGTVAEPDSTQFPGEYEWTPPEPGAQIVRAVILEFTDVDLKYRFLFPRGLRQGSSEQQLVRTDAVNLPLEYAALAAEPDTWFLQTDDPAFAPNGS